MSERSNKPSSSKDNSSKLELKEEARRLAMELGDISLTSIRDMFSIDPEAISEEIMGDGEPVSTITFTMPTPKAETIPESMRRRSISISLSDDHWYPHRFEESTLQKETLNYLHHLCRGKERVSEAFIFLREAEAIVDKIGCKRSTQLWKFLSPIVTQLSNLDLPEMAMDICEYLYTNPDLLYPYLKCITRVKPFLVRTSERFNTVEERATQLISMFDTTLEAARYHQEESMKFAAQVSNTSTNLANLQELIEKTVLKVKKLDLLPETGTVVPSGISIPSTSTKLSGQKIIRVDLSQAGEYSGLYSFKVERGRIKSISPPKNIPELTGIIELSAQAQAVLINLNQAELLNRISAHPEYRQAFLLRPIEDRRPLLSALCRGIPEGVNQWVKMDYSLIGS